MTQKSFIQTSPYPYIAAGVREHTTDCRVEAVCLGWGVKKEGSADDGYLKIIAKAQKAALSTFHRLSRCQVILTKKLLKVMLEI